MKARVRKLESSWITQTLWLENAIRVSTYDALVKSRRHQGERAAQAARSVTVDFGKGGDNKAFLNSLYPVLQCVLAGQLLPVEITGSLQEGSHHGWRYSCWLYARHNQLNDVR